MENAPFTIQIKMQEGLPPQSNEIPELIGCHGFVLVADTGHGKGKVVFSQMDIFKLADIFVRDENFQAVRKLADLMDIANLAETHLTEAHDGKEAKGDGV